MKNNLDNLIIIFFIFLIFVLKIYFAIVNPIPDGGTVWVVNSFLFFNFKGFLIDPSSFNDWNHIGTPIYYIYSLINLIFSGQLADNYKFFIYASHMFIFFLYVIAISFFVKFLKKSVELKYIFATLLIFFSPFSQFESLENINPHSFQGPLVLILVSFFINIFFNKKKLPSFFELIILCFIFLFATSVKSSLLPFCIAFYIALIFFIFQNQKATKFFLIFNFLIILLILFINLPIAGRLPVILYNILFSRNDTSFDILSVVDLAKIFIEVGIKENIFYLIIIFINIYLFSKFVIIDNIIKFFKKDIEKSDYSVIIFSTLVFFSYLYLILSASEDYVDSKNNNLLGIVYRHVNIYSIFIIFVFLFYKTRNVLFKNLYICLVIIAFLFSVTSYINNRNFYISEINERDELFQTYLSSKIKKNDKIAVFNNSLGYGFASENNFYRANNLMQNDIFSEFAYKQYPKIRYLRLHDFLWSQKIYLEKNIDFKKKLMVKWDGFLKDHLSNKVLYKFFSYKSLELSGNHIYPSQFRSKNLFLKKENEKISYAVFPYSELFKEFSVTPEEFIVLVNENYKVSLVESFDIKGDNWFLISFAQ